MSNILIIPDIHGRTFWKECIKCECDEIIFLGDYLDPYNYEGISKQDALDNFKEILKFKSDNYDKVTLLLGNHDMEYISYNLPRDRYDSKNGKEIRRLFLDNIDMFNLVTYRYIKNKFISFSHSVIGQCWINNIKNIDNKINSMNIIDFITYLNDLVKSGDERKMGNILNHIGYSRGGYDPYGSVIWADVNEALEFCWEDKEKVNKPKDIDYQIFSHTQQSELPIITKYYACLDCRAGFLLNSEGILKNITNNEKEFTILFNLIDND